MTMQTATIPARLLLATVIGPEEIGKRIKRARERKTWTQLQLAMEANVSPSSVARWESGKLPPIRELTRIAGVLGIETSELVEEPREEASDVSLLRSEVSELRSMLEELLRRAS